jgi:hypothetical protein
MKIILSRHEEPDIPTWRKLKVSELHQLTFFDVEKQIGLTALGRKQTINID